MKKTTISLLFIALIICSFIFTLNLITVNAQTGTDVSGIISQDTMWAQANSPYSLTGNLLVTQNVTLTIQPGVVVNLNTFYIMVNGTLNAVGNSTNSITFNEGQITITQPSKDWNKTNSAGSIIENALISSTLTLSNSAKIDNSTIYGLIIIQETVGTVISNNIIRGGIFCFYNASANISNNIIMNNAILMGTAVNQNMTICGNTISGADSGIVITTGGPSFDSIFGLIENNLIVNNTNGIDIKNYGGPIHITIRNNTITNNDIGILSTFPTTVLLNNIYSNSNYNIYNNINGLNSTYNWWGTTNSTTISKSIYNDPMSGTVTYTPFLTAPNTQAPTYINATTGSGGSISPIGIIKLHYYDNQTFAITPNTDCHITDVLVNGTSVGIVNSYTIQNISGVTTISATFAANPTPTPSHSPSPSPIPTPSPSAKTNPSPTQTPIPTSTSNPTNSTTTNPTNTPTENTKNDTLPTPTPTLTSTPNNFLSSSQLFIDLALIIVVAVLGIAVVCLLVYVRRIKRRLPKQ